jgi:hypothetical protein
LSFLGAKLLNIRAVRYEQIHKFQGRLKFDLSEVFNSSPRFLSDWLSRRFISHQNESPSNQAFVEA